MPWTERVCSKCKNTKFRIFVRYSCDDCEYNGSWNSLKQEYEQFEEDKLPPGRQRDQVAEEGECLMSQDNVSGVGCEKRICTKCGAVGVSPYIEY